MVFVNISYYFGYFCDFLCGCFCDGEFYYYGFYDDYFFFGFWIDWWVVIFGCVNVCFCFYVCCVVFDFFCGCEFDWYWYWVVGCWCFE